MFEAMLAPTQKHSLRTAALEILLLFYEALGDPEKEFVALLPSALDLTPFLPDFPADTKFRHRQLVCDTVLVARDPKVPYSKEESLDLINLYLNFMSEPQRLDKFQQWFGFLKTLVLPSLFPTICRQLGLLDAADDTGFTQHCPYEIQASIIDFLHTWTQREDINAYLWNGEQAALMLEIYRQACLMPASRHENIKKAFLVFKDCLFMNVPKTIPEGRLVSFRKWYWEQLTFIVPDSTLNQDHYKLIAESLNLYDSVVASLWTTLSPAVQEIILITSLELATRALKRPDVGGVDRNLCPVLVEGLLLLWINARVTDPNLWRALQERLRTFFHRKDAIAQCKFKLIQLTLVLENFMFSFDAHNKYEAKKSKQQTKRSESQFPDPVMTFDVRPDPVIKEKDWDWNSAQLVWFNILEIFRYTNGLEDPGAYLESIDALTTAAEMILSAYERSDFEEPEIPLDTPPGSPLPPSPSSRPSLSLISIFGPWLFEAAKRPIVYAEGKALANRTLCRLVVRQSHINLPLPLLSHFYDCVQVSLLEFSLSKAAWAILEHSTAIFSMGLPGANLLIPYYLTEISKIFTKVDHIAEKVREAALTIIASLVVFPSHFNGLQIPYDTESAKLHKLAEPVAVPGVTTPTIPATQVSPLSGLSFADLKYRIVNLLILVVSREPKAQLVCMALNAINTYIWNEINHPEPNSAEIVLALIRAVITCTLKETRISHSALTCLGGLASVHYKLHSLDSSIVSKICYQLVLNISTRQLTPGLEITMVSHYDALLEWMLAVPPSYYEDSKLIKKIFMAIDTALRNLEVVTAASPLSPTGPAPGGAASANASSPSSPASATTATTTATTAAASATTATAGGVESLGGNKLRLRRAVEQLLINMSNFSNNWPVDRHYDVIQSQMLDYVEELAEKTGASAASNTPSNAAGGSTNTGNAGTSPLQASDDLPPPPPAEPAVSVCSMAPFVRDTLWYTMNEKHLLSVIDFPSHKPEILDSNEHQALAFCLASTHYIYFFRAFLRQHGLADAISLYYEDQQYLASGVDRRDVHARALALVRLAQASPMLSTAQGSPAERLMELTSKSTQPADVQLWYLLYVSFQCFKTSPYWSNSQEHLVRLNTRDSTGKFTWDWTPVGEWEAGELVLRKAVKDARSTATLFDGNFDILGGQTWRMDDINESAEPLQNEISDFEALLTTFKENPFKDISFKATSTTSSLNTSSLSQVGTQNASPSPSSSQQSSTLSSHMQPLKTISPDFFAPKQLIDEAHALMLEYAEAMAMQQNFVEAKLVENRQEQERQLQNATTTSSAIACEPPQPATLLSRAHLTRSLLKNLGFLSPSRYSNFTLLDTENARFKRLIKQFDTSTYGHEVTKIGLVYVKDGQENERSMLRNEESDSSSLYQEFVKGVSPIVSIARHCGYVGGLDRSGTVGTTLPYWRNAMTELVIHEVTRMPTVHKDPQQILKKRHVGNDIIHVIWSEHCRDYKPQTIVSQFNDAHVMIFPLSNGLFRIKVAQKREVAPFGPLIHNMAVTKELLAILARQTALVANSVVRFSHEHYMGQYSARRNALNEIVTKNSKPVYHEYVAACFPSPEPF